jgi:hypothetical protein
MHVSTTTVYRVSAVIPYEELRTLGGGELAFVGDKVAAIIERAGWARAFRRDRPTSCSNGYHLDALGLEFEVATQEEQDRLVAWLRSEPFARNGEK